MKPVDPDIFWICIGMLTVAFTFIYVIESSEICIDQYNDIASWSDVRTLSRKYLNDDGKITRYEYDKLKEMHLQKLKMQIGDHHE